MLLSVNPQPQPAGQDCRTVGRIDAKPCVWAVKGTPRPNPKGWDHSTPSNLAQPARINDPRSSLMTTSASRRRINAPQAVRSGRAGTEVMTHGGWDDPTPPPGIASDACPGSLWAIGLEARQLFAGSRKAIRPRSKTRTQLVSPAPKFKRRGGGMIPPPSPASTNQTLQGRFEGIQLRNGKGAR